MSQLTRMQGSAEKNGGEAPMHENNATLNSARGGRRHHCRKRPHTTPGMPRHSTSGEEDKSARRTEPHPQVTSTQGINSSHHIASTADSHSTKPCPPSSSGSHHLYPVYQPPSQFNSTSHHYAHSPSHMQSSDPSHVYHRPTHHPSSNTTSDVHNYRNAFPHVSSSLHLHNNTSTTASHSSSCPMIRQHSPLNYHYNLTSRYPVYIPKTMRQIRDAKLVTMDYGHQ
ncbi:hypothetical protein ECG_02016 [Echinococcus granulosus]|nr:hypothetical protein ECG_02016 [Echinococcus granulosus]